MIPPNDYKQQPSVKITTQLGTFAPSTTSNNIINQQRVAAKQPLMMRHEALAEKVEDEG
jgi:hypothetical protein